MVGPVFFQAFRAVHGREMHGVASVAVIALRRDGHSGQSGRQKLLGHRLARLLAGSDDTDRGRLPIGGLCAQRLDEANRLHSRRLQAVYRYHCGRRPA